MIDLIIMGVVVVLLNVLDSVTTELGFRLPEHLRTKESNPFAKRWLEKSPKSAHLFKQVSVIGIVVFMIMFGDMRIMVMVIVLLGWVVANNSYIWIGRKITKRKIHTPFYKACKACHIPEKYMYFAWVAVAIPTALAVGYLLF